MGVPLRLQSLQGSFPLPDDGLGGLVDAMSQVGLVGLCSGSVGGGILTAGDDFAEGREDKILDVYGHCFSAVIYVFFFPVKGIFHRSGLNLGRRRIDTGRPRVEDECCFHCWYDSAR